jgi:hypothetical protein
MSAARASASSTSDSRPVPGSSGTPAVIAASRAVCLLPNTSRCSGDGPANAIPASSQARAKAASSERKP